MAQQKVMQNPYGAPRAMVGDAAEEFQPVKLFAVSGRIGRARFVVYSMLVSMLIMLVAGMSMAVLGHAGIAVLVVGYIAMFVLQIMLTIQRSHDFNMSGWFALLAFVPFVNLLFWFVPGTDGPNQFGAKTPPNSVGVLIGVWIVPVVFVLGVAAGVAVPAYKDYQARAAAAKTR
jgi:uncharacterized membrane protein YhaH (DUF805 family)